MEESRKKEENNEGKRGKGGKGDGRMTYIVYLI